MKNKKVKLMIESISKPKDLYGVVMLDLPWIEHPLSYMSFDQSRGRDSAILRKVKKAIGELKFQEILDYIGDCGDTYDFNIVKTNEISDPYGEWQDEDGYFFNRSHVSQSCGICGDDYSGVIHIPFTKQRSIQFQFNC